MNSDELNQRWEDLWRSQPAAPSAVNLDEFHASLRAGPDAWEEELAHSESIMMTCAALQLISGLADFGEFLRPGSHWSHGLLLGAAVAMGGGAWFLRQQRLWLQSEYGPSVLERIKRVRRVIRQRMRFDAWSAMLSLPLAAVAGLWAVEWFGASWEIGVVISLIVLAGMFWAARSQFRRGGDRLLKRIEALDRAEAQLTGNQPFAGRRAD